MEEERNELLDEVRNLRSEKEELNYTIKELKKEVYDLESEIEELEDEVDKLKRRLSKGEFSSNLNYDYCKNVEYFADEVSKEIDINTLNGYFKLKHLLQLYKKIDVSTI